jgi:hypothetical protein
MRGSFWLAFAGSDLLSCNGVSRHARGNPGAAARDVNKPSQRFGKYDNLPAGFRKPVTWAGRRFEF